MYISEEFGSSVRISSVPDTENKIEAWDTEGNKRVFLLSEIEAAREYARELQAAIIIKYARIEAAREDLEWERSKLPIYSVSQNNFRISVGVVRSQYLFSNRHFGQSVAWTRCIFVRKEKGRKYIAMKQRGEIVVFKSGGMEPRDNLFPRGGNTALDYGGFIPDEAFYKRTQETWEELDLPIADAIEAMGWAPRLG